MQLPPVNDLGTIDRRPFEPHLTFMVSMAEQADLSAVSQLPRGEARKRATFDLLMATAARTQGPILDVIAGLAQLGAVNRVERLFSPNMLVVSASGVEHVDTVLDTLHDHGVPRVYRASDGSRYDFTDRKRRPTGSDVGEPDDGDIEADGHDVSRRFGAPSRVPATPNDWQHAALGTHEAWRRGATGAGTVFGSIDTGVDGTHPALAGSYRGSGGSHDHNWFDFGTEPSAQPRDYRWHGTHTTGSVVGRGPAGAFGVAPDAKWIGVAAMTPQRHDVLNLLRAVQWMQAPTARDGSTPDPTAAPDVVGMSWWAAPSAQDLFRDSIRNLVGAGIVPVKSMGNQGPGPETGTSPGQFEEIYAVTSVGPEDVVPDFASRGPSSWHVPGERPPDKPDVAAPGVAIRSSVPGNEYATWSGTSMAQPHLAGTILAVLGTHPDLTDAELRAAIEAGARDIGPPGRDPESGMGVVDMPATLAAADRIVQSRQRAAPAA